MAEHHSPCAPHHHRLQTPRPRQPRQPPVEQSSRTSRARQRNAWNTPSAQHRPTFQRGLSKPHRPSLSSVPDQRHKRANADQIRRPDGVVSTAGLASPRRARMTLAGIPAATIPAGTSCRTSAPAATTAPRPMVTPSRTIAPAPIQAPSSTVILARVIWLRAMITSPSSIACPADSSLACGPIKTSSPISSPPSPDRYPPTFTIVREPMVIPTRGSATTSPSTNRVCA